MIHHLKKSCCFWLVYFYEISLEIKKLVQITSIFCACESDLGILRQFSANRDMGGKIKSCKYVHLNMVPYVKMCVYSKSDMENSIICYVWLKLVIPSSAPIY